MHTLLRAGARLGLRRLQPFAASQSLVVRATWQGRDVVAKLRHASHARRLHKEARWLGWASTHAIAAPAPIAVLSDAAAIALVLPRWPAPPLALSPRARLAALDPLHQAPLDAFAPGWGPLRADDRPRWRDPDAALRWYHELIDRLDGPVTWHQALDHSWPQRVAGLIHGDLHPANRAGAGVLDWEAVALADPWEDAARAALVGGGEAAWRRACGADVPGDATAQRWAGAWWRAVLEAASFVGPRQRLARAWLAQTSQNAAVAASDSGR